MLNSIFELMNKYNIDREESIKVANSILENRLVVKYQYLPEVVEEPHEKLRFSENFNWRIELQDYTNMAMLHLHAWEPVCYLLITYHYTKNDQYLNKAIEHIESWYQHSLNENHKYLYYPHCVADRALILSYIIELNNDKFNSEYIKKLIIKHRNYLLNDENYVKYNHGTMLDRSLILLSIVSNDDSSLYYSFRRLKNNVTDTFTKNMICKENSITYSVLNIELVISTQKFLLNGLELELLDNFDYQIGQALDFLHIVKKPDGSFPMYGDGEFVNIDKLKHSILYKFYPEHNLFNTENHLDKVIQPFYFKYEGYLILKNHNFHLFLRTGDIIKNHKHADDLSFTLYIGKDILVDPGTYNYDKGEIRNYLKSAAAHNSIILSDENYNYLKTSSKQVYIHSFDENDEFFHIVLINDGYTYASITRNIYIFKHDYSILLVDKVYSSLEINSSQVFNFSKLFKKNFRTKFYDENKIIINNEIVLNSNEVDSIDINYNHETIYSEKFHQSEIIPKIIFNKSGNKTSFITSLTRPDVESQIEILSTSNNNILLNYNEKHIELPVFFLNEDKKIDRYIHTYKRQNMHHIEIHINQFSTQEYAIYIYKNDYREAILWYQDSPKFEYNFESSGNYRIRSFVRNKENKNEKNEFSMHKNIIL